MFDLKAWRTAPRLFESVKAQLLELALDALLDIAETRGLAMITDEQIEEINEADLENCDEMIAEIVERILDTAYLGFDLYTLSEKDLEQRAEHFGLEADKGFVIMSSWSSVDTLIAALRPAWREAAMKGKYTEHVD